MGKEGLRERKKRQTENAIEIAGATLARELGHSRVTVAQICDHANISRSTFFNYMPSREAAIFGKPIPVVEYQEANEILTNRGDASLALAMFRVVIASVGHSKVHPTVVEERNKLLAEQPETQPLVLAPFTTLATELKDFLVQWFEHHPDQRSNSAVTLSREAALIVLLTVSAFQVMLFEVNGKQDVTLSEELFLEAVAQLGSLADATLR